MKAVYFKPGGIKQMLFKDKQKKKSNRKSLIHNFCLSNAYTRSKLWHIHELMLSNYGTKYFNDDFTYGGCKATVE